MKLRDSLAENKSIRLQAEAETWQDAVKIGVDPIYVQYTPGSETAVFGGDRDTIQSFFITHLYTAERTVTIE